MYMGQDKIQDSSLVFDYWARYKLCMYAYV